MRPLRSKPETSRGGGNDTAWFNVCLPEVFKTYTYINIQWCWVKRDQLEVTCFIISLFNAQHVSDVNTSILRGLRLFMGCIALVRCVLVLRCGLAVVVWYPYAGFSLHTDTTPPQPNFNVGQTHFEKYQYNPWNNSTNKSQAPEDGCINIRNMLSII